MVEASYSSSLPDSEALVNANTEALIALLPTFSSFLTQRAALEREFSKSLSKLTGAMRVQANKEAADRFGRDSTLELAYGRVLEQTDLDAREHDSLAHQLETLVANPLMQAGTRLELVRKKHHAYAGRLLSERDKAYSERDSSRKGYFDACESLESARQKKGQAKDDRQAEKAARSYQTALEDMHIAKNQFLISTETANAAKARLYTSDLPALHDEYQLLGASTVNQLIHLMRILCSAQRDSLTKLQGSVDLSEQAVDSIDVRRDQEMFLTMHSASKLAGYQMPSDLGFEECPVWHDTEEMSTTPSSIIYLQNVKLKAMARLGEVGPAIESKQREIAGLRNLRDAYERDRSLGDAGSVLENLFDSTHDTTLLEVSQTELKAQVDLIDATLGDAGQVELRLHDLHKSSFVTPSTCAVCEGSVWGKGLSCKICQLAVHSKCELKVGSCTGKAGGGVTRSHSKRHSHTPSTNAAVSSSPTTLSSTSAAASTSSSGMPPPRRVPPPTASSSASNLPSATMLYDYAAATGFELSVSETEVVSVVEPEDESGWVKVKTADGRVGLVPASYLQLGGAAPVAHPIAENPGQQVIALYDYTAGTADEHSLIEGETVDLTSVGLQAGDGWAEVLKDGRAALVPISYLQV